MPLDSTLEALSTLKSMASGKSRAPQEFSLIPSFWEGDQVVKSPKVCCEETKQIANLFATDSPLCPQHIPQQSAEPSMTLPPCCLKMNEHHRQRERSSLKKRNQRARVPSKALIASKSSSVKKTAILASSAPSPSSTLPQLASAPACSP